MLFFFFFGKKKTNKHRYVTIRIKMDHTTALDAIQQGVEKLDEAYQKDDGSFVLKVVGQEEYIYGRRKIVDYEAVRNSVRNEDDVEFVLLKRPDFKQRIEEEKTKQQHYTNMFKSAYPPKVNESGFFYEDKVAEKIINGTGVNNGNESTACDFLPETAISLYECDWNYRLKIEGLTNCCALPRFEEATMKSVYVVAELWVGDMMFESATLQTENATAKNEIRWGSWLSSRSLTFSQIPREAILCFQVMGVGDNGAPRCLAWCRMPLVDHRHRLRRSKYLLNMWEIPSFKVEKDGPKTDPYAPRAFRYRGATRDKHVKHIDLDQCQVMFYIQFVFEVIQTMSCLIFCGLNSCWLNLMNLPLM
ncbi:phosphatidylinositol-4,5-bisphosphate 3-kinase catalytic subunit gamma isoform [Reticulomyxa filosa]|uniref:Phosphatidylinositol-4,5-bisphosphate 3-kinase catalytic subunit gamma isoform n=1 Tax=Reticulomyxa filosa TaxID=46433 RepID=X6P6Y9_RETFI|nr:phosphatidylinositol-4,5-bisphosphate 3-kinase catalytic subunit gamma isoform [Reticulomyxa filosa]|eukprot:ETO33863.1 phosphatidylinositol-4,5-bisphosphate 3-kinase catalytic subunit gamma isoform [Reticulomyxa filosa]